MNEVLIAKVADLSLHDEALTTPRMRTEQYEALKESIDVHGQLDPATTYRGKIVDGRHRWLILQELGIETIKVVKMPNNSTLLEIKSMVRSKETRRHETTSQLAITAYRLSKESKDRLTQADAAKQVGVNPKRVSEAKTINDKFSRPDILELLFNGGKFNVGSTVVPSWTDSLNTILRWLKDGGGKDRNGDDPVFDGRDELSEEEQLIVNKFVNALSNERLLVQEQVSKIIFAKIQQNK